MVLGIQRFYPGKNYIPHNSLFHLGKIIYHFLLEKPYLGKWHPLWFLGSNKEVTPGPFPFEPCELYCRYVAPLMIGYPPNNIQNPSIFMEMQLNINPSLF